MGNGDGPILLVSSFVETHSFRKGRENGALSVSWASDFLV
jgi:hypothetical protein